MLLGVSSGSVGPYHTESLGASKVPLGAFSGLVGSFVILGQ